MVGNTKNVLVALRMGYFLREETRLGEVGDCHFHKSLCQIIVCLMSLGLWVYFEKHEATVVWDTLRCEERRGDRDAAEGFDGVEVKLHIGQLEKSWKYWPWEGEGGDDTCLIFILACDWWTYRSTIK